MQKKSPRLKTKRSDVKHVLSIAFLVIFTAFLIIPTMDPSMTRDRTGSLPDPNLTGSKMAIVKPVFTATAYSSYYKFYSKYANTPNGKTISSDLRLLDAPVLDAWGWSGGLWEFISSNRARDHGIVAGKNLTVLTDVGVTQGALFNENGSNRFRVVILGFTEYVTSQEYSAYQRFVATGGRLILMDATNFLAEVRYVPDTNHLVFVRGHGWGFDGKKAWRDVFDRWADQDTNWVGSTFCCSGGLSNYDGALLTGNHSISLGLRDEFGPRVFRSYFGHEENQVTNMTGTVILARWVSLSPGMHSLVAAYVHHYAGGMVIHIGVMGSDVVSYDKSVQSFLIRCVFHRETVRVMVHGIIVSNDRGSLTWLGSSIHGKTVCSETGAMKTRPMVRS